MKPPTGFTLTTRPFESMDAGRFTQPEQVGAGQTAQFRGDIRHRGECVGVEDHSQITLYSCLNASIGCTPAARRAGIQLAARATASKVNTPPIIVAGSHG